MGLTRPIPDEAMTVVEVLRRDVPRPELPLKTPLIRWSRGVRKYCCAMGLHPLAKDRTPICADDFGKQCSDLAVKSFYLWHDEQTDPQALVDAIWPEGGA